MAGVREGYEFFLQHAPGVAVGVATEDWIASISEEIEKTIDNLESFTGSNKGINFLSGDLMEFYHAGTANIDAARQGLIADFEVPRSTGFGTPDITSASRGIQWQVKYGATAKLSAKYQVITYGEAARRGSAEAAKLLESGSVGEHDSVYYGMGQIIPKGQLDDAQTYIRERMLGNAETRPELVARDQHFLDNGAEGIETADGVRSSGLDRAGSKQMAVEVRDGQLDPEKWGLTIEQWVKLKDVLRKSVKAGMTAAVISAVLKAAPEIVKAIQYLIETGELDLEQVKAVGVAAVTGGAKGFLVGTISAAAIGFCQSGLLGEALKDANPHVVAAIAVVAVNAICNGIQIARGKKTGREFVDELTRDSFVAACALIGGGISQAFIEIPVFGYLVGSLVGSIVGSVAYSIGKQAVIAFCVDSGFTMFGLVEQDYTLPDEVLEEIGAAVFEYENFDYAAFEPDAFKYAEFSFDAFVPEQIEMVFLRRGVIGVSKVGYIQ